MSECGGALHRFALREIRHRIVAVDRHALPILIYRLGQRSSLERHCGHAQQQTAKFSFLHTEWYSRGALEYSMVRAGIIAGARGMKQVQTKSEEENMERLKGKNVLITGASSGIGQ